MTTMHAILPGPEMQWAETERPEPGPGEVRIRVAATAPVYEVLQLMRETRNHLVVVDTAAGRTVVTLTDVLHRLLPAQPV